MLLSLVLVNLVLYIRFAVMFYFQAFPFLCTSYQQVKRKLSVHAHKGISMVLDFRHQRFPGSPNRDGIFATAAES